MLCRPLTPPFTPVSSPVAVTVAPACPRELDCAVLRRLEKRVLVGLPSAEARQAMIQHWLPPVSASGALQLCTELDYSLLARVGHPGEGMASASRPTQPACRARDRPGQFSRAARVVRAWQETGLCLP